MANNAAQELDLDDGIENYQQHHAAENPDPSVGKIDFYQLQKPRAEAAEELEDEKSEVAAIGVAGSAVGGGEAK